MLQDTSYKITFLKSIFVIILSFFINLSTIGHR